MRRSKQRSVNAIVMLCLSVLTLSFNGCATRPLSTSEGSRGVFLPDADGNRTAPFDGFLMSIEMLVGVNDRLEECDQ